jgi:hypothetical protein
MGRLMISDLAGPLTQVTEILGNLHCVSLLSDFHCLALVLPLFIPLFATPSRESLRTRNRDSAEACLRTAWLQPGNVPWNFKYSCLRLDCPQPQYQSCHRAKALTWRQSGQCARTLRFQVFWSFQHSQLLKMIPPVFLYRSNPPNAMASLSKTVSNARLFSSSRRRHSHLRLPASAVRPAVPGLPICISPETTMYICLV